jgi:hypothetical protein
MTTTAQPQTAVATTREASRGLLDVNSAKANKRFLDAYTTGKLDRLTPDEQAMFLFALGEKVGLRAELGELMIYQGKPYITIDGRFRIAHSTGLLVGVQPRPATPMEYRHYGCDEGDTLWVCDVYRRGSPRPFRGWGHVTKNDRNPVTKSHPREMAKKRAKYDALRMAFPPAEQIGPVHERFIAEAEEEIRRTSLPALGSVASAEYVENAEEIESTIEGETVAADTSAAESDAGTEAAIDVVTRHPLTSAGRWEIPAGDLRGRMLGTLSNEELLTFRESAMGYKKYAGTLEQIDELLEERRDFAE